MIVTAELLRETNIALGCPFTDEPSLDEKPRWELFADALNQRLAAAPSPSGEPFETIDGENQTHGMVVRNLAMLVRRLAHRIQSKYNAPDDAVAKQAQDYLLGEGLQGSVLREAAAPRDGNEPPHGETLAKLLEDRAAWRKRAEEAEEGLARRIFDTTKPNETVRRVMGMSRWSCRLLRRKGKTI